MIRKRDGFHGERALVLPESIISQMEHNSLLKQLHLTAIGYYPKAENHYRDRKNPISQFIFIYCIDGEGWVEISGERHTILKNNFIIIPSNIVHRYGADKERPWTIYWIHFKGEMAEDYSQNLNSPIEITPNKLSRISERIEIFEEIYKTLERGYSRENLQFSGSLLHHFLGTLRFIQQYRNAPKGVDIKGSDIIDATIHFMSENIERQLSLEEIAGYAGYSRSHFSVLFHERTGFSPTNFFNQLKIRKSCEFLDLTDMKINQICHKIGISDNYYFSRLFKSIMGCSPKEYRANKKG